jgi:PHP family Zn ribbon phosphoesterase
MPQYAYDLHIHTCLSPCGDTLMTAPNIVNMAYLKGLDIIAITDHNTAKNAAAVVRAARGVPLTVIPGVEVTTAEEIHVVCIFPDVEGAEAAGEAVYKRLPPIENRPEYFGEQILMDENESDLGTLPLLLSNATDISIDELPDMMREFGGFCWPAHIDRPSNSILSVFGVLPDKPAFPALEVYDPHRFFADGSNAIYRMNHRILTSSDAHRLVDIAERERFLELEEPSFRALKAALLGGRSDKL